MLQAENDFDQARHPSRDVAMSNIGLDRAQGTKCHARRRLSKRLGQRSHLDRIANERARAMGFNIRNGLGVHARHRLCGCNHFDLSLHTRGGVVCFKIPIVVHRESFDDG